MINGRAEVSIIEDVNIIREERSPHDKAFLRVALEDGRTVDITFNLAQMMGGAAAGAARRLGYQT